MGNEVFDSGLDKASDSRFSAPMDRRSLLKFGAAAGALTVIGTSLAWEGTSSASTASEIKSLKKVLGPFHPKYTGKGLNFGMGAVVPLTGSSASYGIVESQAINLAVSQIKAMGGPHINVIYEDAGQASATLGVSAVRALGADHVPAMVSSFGGNFGAMFPEIAQYKILSIDPGGGTGGPTGEGKPYFWGTISIEPEDQYGGIVQYIKAKMPNVTKFAQVGYDLGTARNTEIQAVLTAALATINVDLVYFGLFPIGATDYTDVLSKLQASGAEASFLFSGGTDIVNYLKQYSQIGLTQPIFTDTTTPQIQSDSGPAIADVYFSLDQFQPNAPSNQWAKVFVETFKGRYHELPTNSAASYYETTFIFWWLIQRVLKKHGNIYSGRQLQDALVALPVFPSVHGGTSRELGVLRLNTKTHSPSRRPIGLYTWNTSKNVFDIVASYNIAGADFKLA